MSQITPDIKNILHEPPKEIGRGFSRAKLPLLGLAASGLLGVTLMPSMVNRNDKEEVQGAGAYLNTAQQKGETQMRNREVQDHLRRKTYRNKHSSMRVPGALASSATGAAEDLINALFKSKRKHDLDPDIVSRVNQNKDVIFDKLPSNLRHQLQKENAGKIVEEGGVTFVQTPGRTVRETAFGDFNHLSDAQKRKILDPDNPAQIKEIGNQTFVEQQIGPQKFRVPDEAIRRTGGDLRLEGQLPKNLDKKFRSNKAVIEDDFGSPVLVEEYINPTKVLGTTGALAGAGALGVGYSALTTEADNPIQYKIQKALYNPEDRVQAEDQFLRGLSSQGGKETSKAVRGALEALTANAVGGATAVPQRVRQNRTFQDVMATDEMLQQANPEERDMLGRAYNSMQKFAPELASDEFATKNYLRESLMAASGPDYATISALAKTNRDVTERKGRF